MIQIYRVESEWGGGMYRCDPSFYTITDIAGLGSNDRPEHISPSQDERLGWIEFASDNTKWYFGFVTKEQYLRWTISPEVRCLLDAYNFQLKIYECHENDVKYSESQAIFIKDNASVVNTLQPSHFD